MYLHVHAFDVKKAWGKEEANENTEAEARMIHEDSLLKLQRNVMDTYLHLQ